MTWTRGICVFCTLFTACVASVVVLFVRSGWDCSFSVPTEALSPDEMWKAEVEDQRCGWPGDIHTISFVNLAPLYKTGTSRVGNSETLIGVDTGGDAAKRPRIAWVNASALRIEVPGLTFFVVRRE